MKKKTIFIVVGALVAILGIVGIDSALEKAHEPLPIAANADGVKFSGKITAVDTGCFYDATCSVSVDGKKVIVMAGGRGPGQEKPVGRILGADSIGDLESRIGDTANVYATTTETGEYSLYGDTNFYIEIAD